MVRSSWRRPGSLQRRIFAGVLGLGSAVLSRQALATEPAEQSVDSALTLATLHPCLPRAELVEDIEDFLERDTIDADVRIKVGETNGTPWFSISVPGQPSTTRAFSNLPGECTEARHVVALSVALAVDALAPASARSVAPMPSGMVLAYGALGTAFPDKTAFGGGAAFRFPFIGGFSPSLGAFGMTSTGQRLGTTPSLRYDATLVGARIEGCADVRAGDSLALFFCGGPVLGAFTTTPAGIPEARSSTSFWIGAVAAFELHVEITRSLFAHVGVDGMVSFRKNQVQVQDREGDPAVRQTFPSAGALFRVGPGVSF